MTQVRKNQATKFLKKNKENLFQQSLHQSPNLRIVFSRTSVCPGSVKKP